MSLVWNRRRVGLGAPVQLIQGSRYQSRMLVALPQGQSCGDVVNAVRQMIASSTLPWQNLVVGGVTPPSSQIPPDWPAGMATLPFPTPGACLILLDGIWGAPTQTVDSGFPPLAGTFPWDFWNFATPQQKLVQGPTPPGPCDPSQLTFDIASGLFRCAGVVMQPPVSPPLLPINIPPVVTPPITPPVTPPPPKTEEKKSIVPWLVGGAALLGVGVLIARS